MATRRCISGKVVESDAFYSLSPAAQALYIHINMAADDLGFCNSVNGILCRISGGESAFQELKKKRFVLCFGEVTVIKHWKMANTLKNDRMKPLTYPDIAAMLYIKDNKAYTDRQESGGVSLYESYTGQKPVDSKRNPNGIQTESKWNPNGILTEPNRIEPNRIEPNPTEGSVGGDGGNEWFERVYGAYPVHRRGTRESAIYAWRAAVKPGQEDAVLLGLDKWKQSKQWGKEGGQYVPSLFRFLTEETWARAPEEQEPGSRELDADELAAIRRMQEEYK